MSNQMDTHMKKLKKSVSSLPFDCWCDIASFLDDANTYVSLLLTLKGLNEYIRNINHFTAASSITFLPTKFPKRAEPHVLRLLCESRKKSNRLRRGFRYSFEPMNMDEYLASFDEGCETPEQFLTSLFRFFPNLEYLRVNFSKLECPGNLTLRNDTVNLNFLKVLDINVTRNKLTLASRFPSLVTLSLKKYWHPSDLYSQDDKNLQFVDFERCFPILKIMKLKAWNVDLIGSGTLETLVVKCCVIDRTFNKYPNLTSLSIYGSTLNLIDVIDPKSLPKLRELLISSYKECCEVTSRFSIRNFPNLRSCVIENYPDSSVTWSHEPLFRSNGENRGEMMLHNLPNLRELVGHYGYFPLKLKNVPNLRSLEMCIMYNNNGSDLPPDIIFDDFSYLNLETIKIKTEFLPLENSNNLLADLSMINRFKKLKHFEYKYDYRWTHCYDDVLLSLNLNPIMIDDLPLLEDLYIKFFQFKVKSISNCPNLSYLNIYPSKDFSLGENLFKKLDDEENPSGPDVTLEFGDQLSERDDRYNHHDENSIAEVLRQFQNLEFYDLTVSKKSGGLFRASSPSEDFSFVPQYSSIASVEYFVLRIDSPYRRYTQLKNVTIVGDPNIRQSFESFSGSFVADKVTLKNLKNLEELIPSYTKECTLAKNISLFVVFRCGEMKSSEMELEDCPKLRKAVIETNGRLRLENLPSLRTLVLMKIPEHCTLRNSPNIRFLQINLTKFIEEKKEVESIAISDESYPQLEILVLVADEIRKNSTLVKIKCLKNLKNLKNILLVGRVFYEKEICPIQCVSGLELRKCVVHVVHAIFDYYGKVTTYNNESSVVLGEYISSMKKKNFVIDIL